jgi:CelD/BcsL family acetyltransferase involved in cellulose biosynthesis
MHQVGYGVAAVDAVRDTYDAIAPLPVTARWAWLRTCADCFAEWRPVVVTVPDGTALAAAALLAVRRAGPLTLVTLLGGGRSDYAALPARDAAAATHLARGVAEVLRGVNGPWRLRLSQLPADDPVADALAGTLRCAEVEAGEGAPAIVFDGRTDAYANKNLRKQLRKARNRLRDDGIDLVADVTSDPAGVRRLLPEIAPIHVARDHEARGYSDHDDPRVAAFWRAVLTGHAERDEVEVTTLRVQGDLVAYAVCFRDGTAYRFWDSRYAPGWARYSLGRLVDDAVVERVLAEGRWTEFDWMRGVEDYKLQSATEVRGYESLSAWSSPSVRRAETLARSARRLRRGPRPRPAS